MRRRRRSGFFGQMMDALISLWEFLSDNKKKVMPVILIICVAATILIAIHANRVAAGQAMAEADGKESATSDIFESTQAGLSKNAYPEINALIERYFDAYVSGDVAILNGGIYRTLDEIEKVTIEERAKYIEELANITVYTKPGPVEDSWVVYAYSDVRYIGCEQFLPGMVSFYVCRDENGTYYINADETTQSIKDYITQINLQDDVVDLYNRVNVEYADRLQSDNMFSELVAAIYAEIDESIGERLVGAEEAIAAAEANPEPEQTAQPAATGASKEMAAVVAASEPPKEIKIRAITNVNVRSSDSTEASVLGKAHEGEEYVRIAEQGNGWSKISFAGSAAYVKSEFFEVVTEDAQATGAQHTDEQDAEAQPAGADVAASTSATAASAASTAGTTASAAASIAASASTTGASSSTAGTGASASTGASKAATTASSAASTGKSTASAAGTTAAATGASTSTGAGGISGTGSKLVIGGGVRVRTEPNTDSDILATLYGGARVDVKKIRDDGWCEVTYNGKTGYVKAEFLAD
ncbi:MAG: SH3 domain-containing protein [Lachnospiraceae bacterium]|nr:SH3 domain-containing protein [Lachnospiraceae bacterium]